MRVRLGLNFTASLAILGTLSLSAAFAQDQLSFKNFSIETLSRLNGNCRGSTEVNYRSQRLRSPDGKTSVYFSGIIRRVGQNNSRRGGVGAIKCNPYRLETPAGELAIEDGTTLRKNLAEIGFQGRFNGLYLVNPIAFSSDSRYLIARVDVSSNGLDAWNGYAILDSQKNYQSLALHPCRGTAFGGTYKGFISPSEILFDCSESGLISFDILNLQRQSVNRVGFLPVSNQRFQSYGTVLAPFEIVRVRHLTRR